MEKPSIAVIGLKGLPAIGGAASVGESIIAQLKNEFNFTVYAISSHTNSNYKPDGFRQIIFRSFLPKKINTFYYYLSSAFHALFFGKYHLIHLHHVDGGFIIPLLKLRYKVICTAHARPQEAEKWGNLAKIFLKYSERIALRRANTITSVAAPLQNLYQRITKRKVHYIPNGIDVFPNFKPDDIEFKDYLLFAAGRIIPLKGCHLLMEALHKIGYKGLVLIIGDLEQMPKYKQKLINLSNGLNIVFIGLIRDKKKLLSYVKNAKIFVFPSYNETMSVMLLEAVLMKAPIISSDIPENKIIFNQDEVLFFKSEDASDLADKLKWALGNFDEMIGRTNKAYETLNSNYNWSKISSQYSELYLSMMNH